MLSHSEKDQTEINKISNLKLLLDQNAANFKDMEWFISSIVHELTSPAQTLGSQSALRRSAEFCLKAALKDEKDRQNPLIDYLEKCTSEPYPEAKPDRKAIITSVNDRLEHYEKKMELAFASYRTNYLPALNASNDQKASTSNKYLSKLKAFRNDNKKDIGKLFDRIAASHFLLDKFYYQESVLVASRLNKKTGDYFGVKTLKGYVTEVTNSTLANLIKEVDLIPIEDEKPGTTFSQGIFQNKSIPGSVPPSTLPSSSIKSEVEVKPTESKSEEKPIEMKLSK